MSRTAVVARQFGKYFREVHRTRMTDMPMVNPKLRVQAVGFREWDEGVLGVLVMPWSMNLIFVPEPALASGMPSAGCTIHNRFPSGSYEFIVAEEPDIGRYQMCSMFSPMFEFKTQARAVATAKAIMAALMDPANLEPTGIPVPHEVGAPETTRPRLGERLHQPMSRRDMLRGAFARTGK
jgi:[NiFe] hydrogenase assembly HybE family chaperone